MAITSFTFLTMEGHLSYFEEFCSKMDCRSTHQIEHLLRYTPWVVAAITLAWGIVLWMIHMLQKRDSVVLNHYKVASVIHTLGGLLVAASFSVMWLALFYFIHLRTRTAVLAGDSYYENECSFRQILALVAMMPLLCSSLPYA